MKQMLFCLWVSLSVHGFSQSRLMDIYSSDLSEVCGFDMLKADNNYLIAGTGNGSNSNDFFCWLTKTDEEFNPAWSKKIKLSGHYYQVNPGTITLSVLANHQIILLAKSMDEDSTYAEVNSFDQNGNFLWGRKWIQPHSYHGAVDLNRIVQLSNNEFIISHSVKGGSTQMKLNAAGTVLSSKYTYLADPNDTTVLGISNLHCSDGGTLQILRSSESRTIVVKLNNQHQIIWAKEIKSPDREVRMVNACENTDGSFWLFGSMNEMQGPPNTVDLVLSLMKLSETGDLTGAYIYHRPVSMGFAELFPIADNEFVFNTTETLIGTINQNTGVAVVQMPDIFQANHGFQNLHKFQDHYTMTGLGANWSESKIHLFPDIDNHPCLLLYEPIQEIHQDTIPMQEMIVTTITPVVDNYSSGTSNNPVIQSTGIRFTEECLLDVSENKSNPEIILYPNPAAWGSDVTLKIEGLKQSEKIAVAISDVHGKQVLYSELNGGQTHSYLIDIHSLQAGMYFVNCGIPGNSKKITEKLIIR